MTTAIDFPFRFEGGSLATTGNYQKLVRNQLIDTLMTNLRERIMRPDYGADIQSLLFAPSDELRWNDTSAIIQERLSFAVPRALIDSVTVTPDSQNREMVYIEVAFRVNEFSEPERLTVPVRGGSGG